MSDDFQLKLEKLHNMVVDILKRSKKDSNSISGFEKRFLEQCFRGISGPEFQEYLSVDNIELSKDTIKEWIIFLHSHDARWMGGFFEREAKKPGYDKSLEDAYFDIRTSVNSFATSVRTLDLLSGMEIGPRDDWKSILKGKDPLEIMVERMQNEVNEVTALVGENNHSVAYDMTFPFLFGMDLTNPSDAGKVGLTGYIAYVVSKGFVKPFLNAGGARYFATYLKHSTEFHLRNTAAYLKVASRPVVAAGSAAAAPYAVAIIPQLLSDEYKINGKVDYFPFYPEYNYDANGNIRSIGLKKLSSMQNHDAVSLSAEERAQQQKISEMIQNGSLRLGRCMMAPTDKKALFSLTPKGKNIGDVTRNALFIKK